MIAFYKSVKSALEQTISLVIFRESNHSRQANCNSYAYSLKHCQKMSDKPIPMPGGQDEQMPPAFENRPNNLDEIDEKDFRPDPARHRIGDGYPQVESTHRREDPYH
ncbi:hypothetical protein DdX_09191 [Ditylenchus destructor]|uniref:Uncharacterized protein n=1 Tax=Ditylenchus destructor TaxID=166010 RepID=A0AAD4R3C0_9BILA|nr:hypothetical protein DdX_09191 [Ditylenchus destructor]